ncbi:MAG: hypothetical protein MUP82_00350 [Candidatus Marinimicrobia bacterium]|nr:hypothetical protein [Candidatus Neomarinimicrobiota bacterium]
MELLKINIFERLRDFNVPAAVLDDIFGNEDDLEKLITAWHALKSDGFSDDDTAKEISGIFFKELDLST